MINEILQETKTKMRSTISVFEDDMKGIRGNRASTGLVDRMNVECYGQTMELRQIANISTPEPMQILIRPYDKGTVKDIERAIQMSDLGINPNVDGENIRLNMPSLTRERRQDLVKVVHKRVEEAKVALRNIRRSSNSDLDEFENEGLISEDDARRAKDEVQKLTNEFSDRIDQMGKEKENDILEV